jgi:hypothetical protein
MLDVFTTDLRERIIFWGPNNGGPMRYDEAKIDEAVLAVL